MTSEFRSGDRTLATLIFRSMLVQSLVISLAVLMATVISRPARSQGTTSTTTTTTYPGGATQSEDTIVTHPDGSTSSETQTEYDEDGHPTSETETIYDGSGHPVSKHTKTWVYDDKGRLIYFESSDETYGKGLMPGVKSGYRVRKKYKNDTDTEGTTTSEQVHSSTSGKWRDFDGDGGDTEPSKEPLQPLPPKKPRTLPPIVNEPLGEEPKTPTPTPEPPKNAPSTPEKPKSETPPASGTQTPEKPSKAPLIPDRPLGEEPHASGGNTSSAEPTEQKTVAIALPANAEAGDTISGTATDDPTEIAEMQEIPGIHITLVPVTQPAQTTAAPTPQAGGDDTLAGVVVEVNGEKQPADKPLVAVLGPAAETISVALVTNDSEARVIGQDSVPVTTATPGPATSTATTEPEDYTMPPVTKPGAVEVIHGADSGNTNDMQIAVDGEPAEILTATPKSVFWKVPTDLPAGAESSAHTVEFTQKTAEGGAPKSVKFPLYGVQVKMTEGRSTLHTGQANPVQVTVTIPNSLTASAWQSGMPPTDLVNLKTLVGGKSGLKPPKPNEEGFIAVLIENDSPGVIRLGKTNTIVLQLHQKDFTDGSYTYNTTLDTIGAGAYVVRSRVVAFVKDAQGQASMNAGN